MPSPAQAQFNERLRFFDGQRLFASDLQDLEQFHRQMRWLHNQSLHQPGVASGYAVAGKKDDREVTIQPGYAIDSSGREIILTEPLTVQVPPVASDDAGRPVYYDLVVSYPADSDLKETETRDGVCVSRSAVRLREEPVVCWIELVPTDDPPGAAALAQSRRAKLGNLNDQIERGVRIRLARAEVLNCKLNQALSTAERRNARPSPQPYLFAGRTPLNGGGWSAVASAFGITIALDVDTSAAQFRTVPRYITHVIGDRQVSVTINGKPTNLILDGFIRPDALTAQSFKFTLLIPSGLLGLGLTLQDIAKALPDAIKSWYVEWLGIEG